MPDNGSSPKWDACVLHGGMSPPSFAAISPLVILRRRLLSLVVFFVSAFVQLFISQPILPCMSANLVGGVQIINRCALLRVCCVLLWTCVFGSQLLHYVSKTPFYYCLKWLSKNWPTPLLELKKILGSVNSVITYHVSRVLLLDNWQNAATKSPRTNQKIAWEK